MDFFRTQKKDAPPGEPPPAADLGQLVTQLGQLGQMLAQVNEQVLTHLARRETAPAENKLAALEEKLETLLRKLDTPAPRPDAPAGVAAAGLDDTLKNFLQVLRQKLDDLAHGDHVLAEAIARIQKASDAPPPREPVVEVPPAPLPPPPVPAPLPAPVIAPRPARAAGPAAGWQQAIVGPELLGAPQLEAVRQRLFDGFLQGEPTASALCGQLLLFQAAAPEKMAPLLKEIGEAYYRWQPKNMPGDSPMELALVAWLKRRCEQSGVPNQIELVNPGERFDALRHHSSARGVEVTDVCGWVVLRDNGRVYTKAAVAVR